jgi:pantoate--beta-alanine ligase
MITVKTVSQLKEYLAPICNQGVSVGFVPTMGALHRGHIELMLRAKQENSVVAVSVFVNPNQFNNRNDLKNYPRTLEHDIAKCEQAGVSVVFAPDVQEIYPEPDNRIFDFGMLDKVMEGKHRPGHFNGVAQVVSRLFDIVTPDRAYFGQKDFQQLAIIRRMAKDMGYNVEIVSCPTVREDDGLAMSSRNVLLSTQQRDNVPIIAKTLFDARNKAHQFTVKETAEWVIKEIDRSPLLEVEYFEIVNAETLEIVNNWSDAAGLVGCIAVQVGDVRLIDNILF